MKLSDHAVTLTWWQHHEMERGAKLVVCVINLYRFLQYIATAAVHQGSSGLWKPPPNKY